MKIRKSKILILIFFVSALILILLMNLPSQTKTYPSRFLVGQYPGFDLTLDQINFGKIIPGFSSSRTITITNSQDYKVKTIIKSSGQISPYVIVSENNFFLEPDQSKNITFTAYPPEDLEYGEYKGQITIITKRVWFTF